MPRARRLLLAAVTVAVTALALIATAPAASAGPGKPTAPTAPAASSPPATTSGQCFFGCSETVNDSQTSVYTGRNWCGGGETRAGDTFPSCTSDGVPPSFVWVYAGDRTPRGQDWDSFRVDGGWCYQVTVLSYPGPDIGYRVYDRRGTNGLWVRVHNNQTAYVTNQSTSGC
jgi:hypothetical protein